MKNNNLSLNSSPGVLAGKNNKFKRNMKVLKSQAELQAMVIPWIILILVFSYIPMYGLIMAFQQYSLGDMVGFSKWVGLKNFKDFFNEPDLWLIMRNTFAISLLKLAVGFPFPIILAILLNEVRHDKFKRTIQTISYLPHFISWVVVAGLAFDILSVDGGIINHTLQALGLIKSPILFTGEPGYFWSIVVATDVWKEIGWSAIIYIAAITSIDQELYEAAAIDGAGRFKKIWHITLSGIKPTIVIMLILAVGGILNAGFEQILLLTNNLRNTMVYDTSEILDTFVYRQGILQMRFSFATAAGVFKSVLSVFLLTIANKAANKISEQGLW